MILRPARRIHTATILIAFTAFVFFLFFQINKGGPFRQVNPFVEDPYDAAGSFAIQVALLVGMLTYARALRLAYDPAQSIKERFILRGNLVILFAVWITLIADALAEVVSPIPPTFWGNVLLGELAFMFGLAGCCAVALAAAFRGMQTARPPDDLTPADGIDDLWTLARVPVEKLSAILPPRLVGWVIHFDSDWLFNRVSWLNPRPHPWRFACALGVLAGLGLLLAQALEGPPPSLEVGLLLAGIFVSTETCMMLLGFTIAGGFLGLRPSFGRKQKRNLPS